MFQDSGKFLGYSTSIVFLGVLGFLVFNAYGYIDGYWRLFLGLSVLIPTCIGFSVFLGLKLWAMYRVDIGGGKPVRRLPTKRG